MRLQVHVRDHKTLKVFLLGWYDFKYVNICKLLLLYSVLFTISLQRTSFIIKIIVFPIVTFMVKIVRVCSLFIELLIVLSLNFSFLKSSSASKTKIHSKWSKYCCRIGKCYNRSKLVDSKMFPTLITDSYHNLTDFEKRFGFATV